MAAESLAKEKSKKFAIRIVRMYKYLSETKNEHIMSKQLLRAGTSIGANLAEAECSVSKKDFLAKVYIALKECAESLYWLELLHDTEFLKKEEYDSIYTDGIEIKKILTATTKTITKNLERQKL